MPDGLHEETVLVTGGGGYLGSILVPLLLDAGYRVKVIDRFFFGIETLQNVDLERCELIIADTRWYPKELLADVYAVIDLAALSNDPSGELDQQRTLDINFHARVRTATIAKEMGVKRYILASSCSVYGFQDGIVDEAAQPAPITTYAQASLYAEQGVLALGSKDFSVTVLRQGTLYGLSPRMRFDLVVNTMSLTLFKEKIINIRGGGQWRPLVHVSDSARAFLKVLEAPVEIVSGQIFNVGSTSHNFQIIEIANYILKGSDLGGRILHEKTAVDTRSYRVSCEKISKQLNFVPQFTPEDGAREVLKALTDGTISNTPETSTIDWYKYLISQDPTILDREFV
ncbi:MAG: SDR family oxidoreductase [Candidatus Magasanikbacteria bacterium]|nr:SDR family oxidoreductase [Candidatus Magasanikbacteria bacterium]